MENKDHIESENYDNHDDNLCCICYNKNKMKNFGCKTCKASICIDCFGVINKASFNYEYNIEIYRYKCPMCSIEHEYDYNYFEKENLITCVRNDFKNLVNKL